jgi:predicted amidophosphoribosyltransferase
MAKGDKTVERCSGCTAWKKARNCLSCVSTDIRAIHPLFHCHICKQVHVSTPTDDLCRDCRSRRAAEDQHFEELIALAYYVHPLNPWVWRIKAESDALRIGNLRYPFAWLTYSTIVRKLETLEQHYGHIDFFSWHPSSQKTLGWAGDHVGRIIGKVLRSATPTPMPRPIVSTLILGADSTPTHRDGSRPHVNTGDYTIQNAESIKGSTILLFDDLYRTGNHLNTAAETLKTAGAKTVIGLALARTVFPVTPEAMKLASGNLAWSANRVPVNGPYTAPKGDDDDLPF